MIWDTTEHIKNYEGLGRVYTALKFLAETDFSKLPLGRAELDGDNIYYMVQEYETSFDRKIESHFEYIDIQAILQGEEIIGVAPISTEKTIVEKLFEKDCCFYNCETQPIIMKPGYFLVLYPNDLHQPGVAIEAPKHCRKVVIKIKCD